MAKIVAISDTHSYHRKIAIPRCDILIHAGDATWKGELDIIEDLNKWFGELKERGIVKDAILFSAGNHDLCFQNSNRGKALKLLTNCIYLEDSSVEIEGLIYYGSPWTPRFGSWAFMADRGEKIAKYWEKINPNTDVLITHGPPYQILDKVYRTNDGVGCEELKKVVKKLKPKAHIFGHIHEGYGQLLQDEILYINAAICDEYYDPSEHEAVIIDIP